MELAATCPPPINRRLIAGATAAITVLVLITVISEYVEGQIGWVRLIIDVLAGGLGCALTPALLRRPLPVALIIVALAGVSPAATPPATLAVLVVAQRRPIGDALGVAVLGVIAHAVQGLLRPIGGLSYGWWLILDVVAHAALVAIGAWMQARARLIASLVLRAQRAEEEQGRRIAEARAAERVRIAREMHDVLAHRLSLVATYAGALEYRPDATPEKRAEAAGVVRSNIQEALDELREVVTALREDSDDHDSRLPQPAAADVPLLVEESRSAGTDVAIEGSLEELSVLPPMSGRTAYRLIQEGLTKRAQARTGTPGGFDGLHQRRRGGDRDPEPRVGLHIRASGQRGRHYRHDRAGQAGWWPAGPRDEERGVLPASSTAQTAIVTRPIRVAIIDDDALVRAGLVMMLDGVGGISIVGEAADGDRVMRLVDEHSPDVILMDIRMPKVDGIAATATVRRRPKPPEVLVLTTFDTDDHVVRALRAGAGGFLLKDTPPAKIVAAIHAVASGEPVMSPQVMRRLMDRVAVETGQHQKARNRLQALSDRETEVVRAVASGQSNAEIAAALFMSVATVKAHISSILSKLDLDNRTQIALLAHDAGLA